MKKHLVAFLSMIGLAGVAAPAQGPGQKGAAEQSNAKTESKIKLHKQAHEKSAAAIQIEDKRKYKWAKADTEGKAARNENWIKGRTAAKSKLAVKQQTLHKQTAASGEKTALTKDASAKVKAAEQK
jgi:hypothetical protein